MNEKDPHGRLLQARPDDDTTTEQATTAESPAATGQAAQGLWRHRDFLFYWTSQFVSRTSVQVAMFTLPLAAIFMFHANASELGDLTAAASAPYLLSMLAGVWIERCRKRIVLIAADLGRASVLAVVPLLHAFGVLVLPDLDVIAFALGMFAVLFDVAGSAYLPTLVGRDHLLDGNGKLQATIVFSKSGGPGLGGVLVQIVTAPATLIVSAVGGLLSVTALSGIRMKEDRPAKPATKRRVLVEIRESLRFIGDNEYLRFLTIRSGVNNIFFTARNTVLPLFVLQVLGLNSAVLGLFLGIGAVGALVGAMLAKKLVDRVGPGRSIVLSYGITSAAQVLLPSAGGPHWAALTVIFSMFFVGGLFMTIGNTNVTTLQQMIIPRQLLSRTIAGIRTVTWGSMSLGGLLGGWLGTVIGIRQALIVTAAGFCLTALWISVSPVRKLRTMPAPVQD